MTPRERFLATLLFQTPDKIPFEPGHPRRSTLEAWHAQGLKPDQHWLAALCQAIGIENQTAAAPPVEPGVVFRMMPTFEEKVLEHKNGHYIVQDWMGNITEISDQFDYTYIRNAVDFVTRKWHRFPVTSRTDFELMKKRYNPRELGRFPEDFAARGATLRQRQHPCGVHISGPFWQLREWCGFEPLCLLFIEDPAFVREMIAFWTNFVARTLEPLLDARVLDFVWFSEDMAYKSKSMLSPAMTHEFLQPTYRRWVAAIKQAGVPVVGMDSDGKVDLLIPIWIESGIIACDPVEVAAGNDINAYRAAFGRRMAYRGGVDKRCMAKGGKVIETELARIAPVVRSGGYIPGCDHGVPPDVSWPDFIHYARLLADLTGWR